jgi:hypothetical protein
MSQVRHPQKLIPVRHIFALSVLAVAQPLFDILGKHVQFFVTSDSSIVDVIGLVVLASTLPALLVLSVQWLLGRLFPALATVGGSILVFVLVVLIIARLLNLSGLVNSGLFFLLAAFFGAAATWLYRRYPAAASFVDFLVIAVFLVPGLFLYQTLVASPLTFLNTGAGETTAGVGKPAPVFFIIIDEVPTTSLQQADGQLDAQRFPNFARLAATSTWYRNATTVADSTEVAVPAMLTGLRPDPAWTNPTASATRHPRNLFTALAGHYQINAFEPVTAMCPPAVCASSRRIAGGAAEKFGRLLLDASAIYAHLVLPTAMRSQLPAVDQYWSGFFNKAKDSHLKTAAASPRDQLLESLTTAVPSSLNFVHIYLPHVPWRYLPSGHVYASHPRDYRIEGFDPTAEVNLWLQDKTAIDLAYQRHLLQLAYVDKYLGQLRERIEQLGLWEQGLFILVADHGLSFKAGEPRRWVTDANLEDIAPVPLFIKYPGQVEPVVVDASAEAIDILPTVFSTLQISSDWDFDGTVLQNVAALEQRMEKRLLVKQRGERTTFVEKRLPADYYLQSSTPGFRQGVFGAPNPAYGLFDVSSNRELLGVDVSSLEVVAGSNRVSIRDVQKIERFRRGKNRLLPAYVRGQVLGDIDISAQIAIALNGKIRAVTRYLQAQPMGRFAVVLPEKFFAAADNHIAVYEVHAGAPATLGELTLVADKNQR